MPPDEKVEVADEASASRALISAINAKYADPIFGDSDDVFILADCLLPLMQDRQSGLSPVALMHLQSEDIDGLLRFPNATRDVISDLTKFTRRSCRQLVAATKEKAQMDKDAYAVERVLRTTVRGLECKKVDLEATLAAETEILARTRSESQALRRQNEIMMAKMETAHSHLISAGVFDDCGGITPTPLGVCGDRRLMSDRVISMKTNASVDKPRWRY